MESGRILVLASTSRYRRALLERLGLSFECVSPGVAEDPLPDETPAAMAARLAELKARAVLERYPNALIIGSDQVASVGGQTLGKPANHANAVRQLRMLSGRDVVFLTAVALLDAASGDTRTRTVTCTVSFRELDDAAIERYLEREQPYDCAGSAKSEGLGIALLRAIHTDDPTALIGLPLIALTDLLEAAGMPVLGAPA